MTFKDFLNQAHHTHSYRAISRLTGLSPSTVMRIHKDMVKPDYDTVVRIVTALGGEIEIKMKTLEESNGMV